MGKMSMDGREAALEVLMLCQERGGWSDGGLRRQLARLEDVRDGALATQLALGVLQERRLLDFYLEQYSSRPLKRMENRVVQILRLGAYQILWMDRIPHRAAVDCAVQMARRHSRGGGTPGMVNGILRAIIRNLKSLPEPPREPLAQYYGICYSHPTWLVEELIRQLGQRGAEAVCQANRQPRPVAAMVHRGIVSVEQVVESLERDGVEAVSHPWWPDCLLLSKPGRILGLEAFQKGWIYIQDPASRLVALATGVKPGMKVLDLCAAPGGKSFAMAIEMEGEGEIQAWELHPHRCDLLEQGVHRMGLSMIHTRQWDGRVIQEKLRGYFDVVLVDAPCSGLGVIGKKPEIRYKDPREWEGLPTLQTTLLANGGQYVKAGGALIYSTCTILPRENQEVVQSFLKEHPEFVRKPLQLPEPVGTVAEGELNLWPHIHGTDGFFLCRMERKR